MLNASERVLVGIVLVLATVCTIVGGAALIYGIAGLAGLVNY